MRAMVFYRHGGPDVLELADVPKPQVGPDDVLVRVRAVALNHLDIFVREGLPGLNLTMPFILGSDIAGDIAELGQNVRGLAVGQRVAVNPGLSDNTCEFCLAGEHSLCPNFKILGEHVPGGYAEYARVPALNVLPLPGHVSYEDAAAAALVFLTAWRALITQARLRPGETVLILGAGGGVATAAIQVAKLAGAYVYAVSGYEDKLERARALGADEGINYRTMDFSREAFQRTGKRGVDVVLENVGEATWKGSLRAVRKGGRIVTYGATSGPIGETDIRLVFWKQLHIIGATMASQSEFREVMRLVFAGKLRPVIDRVLPLEQARQAQEALASQEQFGKIVLRVD